MGCKDVERGRDNVNGRFYSIYEQQIYSHPRANEILSLFQNKAQLKLTNKGIVSKIQKD